MLAGLLFAGPVHADPIGPDPVGALARGVDVIILGELHDNPDHHRLQAAEVAALQPTAVVWEMLSANVAERLTPSTRDSLGATEAVTRWSQSGWPPLEYYHPIMVAAGDVPFFGAALDRETLAPLFDPTTIYEIPAGFDAYGLGEELSPEEQSAREAAQDEAHCGALPAEMLPAMVLAQRLRDAALAEAALEALRLHGAPVVIITGNGHARIDQGVPDAIFHADPGVEVLSIAHLEVEPDPDAPFDYWRVTGALDRPDPCAAFE